MIRKHLVDYKLLCVLMILLMFAALKADISHCQMSNSWWGSASWFDWSDYRARVNGRVFLAKFASGDITIDGRTFDLTTDLGITNDPEPFRIFCAELYLDRVGVRYYPEEEEHNFWGSKDGFLSELEAPSGFVGFDIELVRLPMFRFGLNMDYGLNKVIIRHRREEEVIFLESDRPNTIGAHLTVIPLRIKQVPVLFEARGAIPPPFMDESNQARMTQWEIALGLRPSIWDHSSLGHSTFAVSVMGGYKSVNMEVSFEERDAELNARWDGAFLQVGLHY